MPYWDGVLYSEYNGKIYALSEDGIKEFDSEVAIDNSYVASERHLTGILEHHHKARVRIDSDPMTGDVLIACGDARYRIPRSAQMGVSFSSFRTPSEFLGWIGQFREGDMGVQQDSASERWHRVWQQYQQYQEVYGDERDRQQEYDEYIQQLATERVNDYTGRVMGQWRLVSDIHDQCSSNISWQDMLQPPSREETEADKKAKKTLISNLSASQKIVFEETGAIPVTNGDSGNKYRVRNAGSYNIDVLDKKGKKVKYQLCITPKKKCPVYDHMLMCKIMLESDEKKVWDTANKRKV